MYIIYGDIELHVSSFTGCLWAVVAIVAIVCKKVEA